MTTYSDGPVFGSNYPSAKHAFDENSLILRQIHQLNDVLESVDQKDNEIEQSIQDLEQKSPNILPSNLQLGRKSVTIRDQQETNTQNFKENQKKTQRQIDVENEKIETSNVLQQIIKSQENIYTLLNFINQHIQSEEATPWFNDEEVFTATRKQFMELQCQCLLAQKTNFQTMYDEIDEQYYEPREESFS